MGEFSITHWLIILAILLLLFGPSKLPGLGSSLGKAIRGFKAGLNGNEDEEPQAAQQSRPEQLSSPTEKTVSEATKVKDTQKDS